MPTYSVCLVFDEDDSQTESIMSSVFDPLCDSFHVAMFGNFRAQKLKPLYNALEWATSRQRPVMITPETRCYSYGQNGFGVYMDSERKLQALREDILDEYPDFRTYRQDQWADPHATLHECQRASWYPNNINTWYQRNSRSGRRFRLRVIGLEVVQSTSRGWTTKRSFYFPTGRTQTYYDDDGDDFDVLSSQMSRLDVGDYDYDYDYDYD